MKKKGLITIVTFFSITSAFCQSDKYISSMRNTIQEQKKAVTVDELIAVEAKFERIANVEKNQWLPYYYASQVKSLISLLTVGTTKELLADQAISLSLKADSLSPRNSEITCIKSLANTSKLMINPMQYYAIYGLKAQSLLEEAKVFDPSNPRPYVLQSMTIKNTPKSFGGGCDKALPIVKKGLELFEISMIKDDILPSWGKDQLEELLRSCKE